MPNFAVIENGKVANIIVAPQGWSRAGVTAFQIQAGQTVDIGNDWDANTNQAIPVVQPQQVPPDVSRFQARAALYQAGYFEQVESLMVAPETPMLMKLAWADAQEFRRDSVTVAAMASALALTSEQVDNLFIAAAQITA